MQFVPEQEHLLFALVDVSGVDPLAPEVTVDSLGDAGIQAQVDVDAAILLARGPEGCAVGQLDDAPGLQPFLDHHIQFGQHGQDAASALVGGGDQFVDDLLGLHGRGRCKLGTEFLPHLDCLCHDTVLLFPWGMVMDGCFSQTDGAKR